MIAKRNRHPVTGMTPEEFKKASVFNCMMVTRGAQLVASGSEQREVTVRQVLSRMIEDAFEFLEDTFEYLELPIERQDESGCSYVPFVIMKSEIAAFDDGCEFAFEQFADGPLNGDSNLDDQCTWDAARNFDAVRRFCKAADDWTRGDWFDRKSSQGNNLRPLSCTC